MKAVVAAFNQEKALVGAFSVIVQPVVEPMDRFAALKLTLALAQTRSHPTYWGCKTFSFELSSSDTRLKDPDDGLSSASSFQNNPFLVHC